MEETFTCRFICVWVKSQKVAESNMGVSSTGVIGAQVHIPPDHLMLCDLAQVTA